jgi:hypothetical protein
MKTSDWKTLLQNLLERVDQAAAMTPKRRNWLETKTKETAISKNHQPQSKKKKETNSRQLEDEPESSREQQRKSGRTE